MNHTFSEITLNQSPLNTLRDQIENLGVSIISATSPVVAKQLTGDIISVAYSYYRSKLGQDFMDDFGLELVNIVHTCINNYNRSDSFFGYLNSSVYKKSKGVNVSGTATKKMMDEDGIESYTTLEFSASEFKNENGEDFSIFDITADDFSSIDQAISDYGAARICSIMEDCFTPKRSDAKRAISAILTNICFSSGIENIRDYSFCNEVILSKCERLGKALSNREVASVLGIPEPNLCRAKTEFFKLLRSALVNEYPEYGRAA